VFSQHGPAIQHQLSNGLAGIVLLPLILASAWWLSRGQAARELSSVRVH
jgi:hypothetical protein